VPAIRRTMAMTSLPKGLGVERVLRVRRRAIGGPREVS
jgi:hypothetical protein